MPLVERDVPDRRTSALFPCCQFGAISLNTMRRYGSVVVKSFLGARVIPFEFSSFIVVDFSSSLKSERARLFEGTRGGFS